MVELHVFQPQFTSEVGEFPCASALARWQLGFGDKVTTPRISRVKIDDSITRHLLPLLDGTRSRLDLSRIMREKIRSGEFADIGQKHDLLRELPMLLKERLQQMAEHGLLIS
jgi:hypothetical protein